MYFRVILFIQLFLIIILTMGCFLTLYKIVKGKISKLYYLLVVLIIIFTPFLVASSVLPKVHDLGNLIQGRYDSTIGRCTCVNGSGFIKEVGIENQLYEFNPWEFGPVAGVKYKIKFLTNSKYIVEWEELE